MIPGVVYHPRSSWQSPGPPVAGPGWSAASIDTLSLHYTAADDLIDGDPGEHADDLPAYLRAIQRDYLGRKPVGFSIGYSFAVDWLGGVWELRGYDYSAAANRGWNHRTVAVLCLVDGADPLTNEAVESVRKILAESNRRVGRELKVRPHSEIGATACPGDGIRRQINSGAFTPWTPTPDPEEDDVKSLLLWRDLRYREMFLIGGGPAVNVSPAVRDHWVALGVPIIREVRHDGMAETCRHQSGLDKLTPV